MGNAAGRYRIVALAATALACCSPSGAQDIVRAVPPDPFVEHFDQNADVSGAKLVGLRLGSLGTTSGPIYVHLADPAASLCIRAVTQDGRYSATNPFSIPPTTAPAVVEIAPISVQYASVLSQYPADAMAVRAFLGDEGCNPADALNVPFSSSPDTDATLVALANSRAFTGRIELADGAEMIAAADCVQAGDGARIAYDLACAVTLPTGEARTAVLSLIINDGFADETQSYRVALPAIRAP